MNYGLHTIDHNFINFRPFGTFNSDLERESYDEFRSTNNGKKILTLFLHLFTGPVIYVCIVNPLHKVPYIAYSQYRVC